MRALSSKRLQRDFTSRFLVTSGHTTVWQNHGHDAGQEYRNAPTSAASMSCGHSCLLVGGQQENWTTHAVKLKLCLAKTKAFPSEILSLSEPKADC